MWQLSRGTSLYIGRDGSIYLAIMTDVAAILTEALLSLYIGRVGRKIGFPWLERWNRAGCLRELSSGLKWFYADKYCTDKLKLDRIILGDQSLALPCV